MKTYTRDDIYDLLVAISNKALDYAPDYGLPLYDISWEEDITGLIVTKLGLTIMEDERILTIQKHTGCTRAQAQSLIDSGDLS